MLNTLSATTESPTLLVVDDPRMRGVFVGVLVLLGVVIAYMATMDEMIFSTRVAIILGYLIGIPLLLSSKYDWSIMLMFAFGSVAGVLKYKTEFNPIIHVTIDIMMALICLGWLIRRMFARRSGPSTRTPLGRLIGVFVFLCVIQIFNPHSYSFIASVASLKMHIFMIPLFFFGYHYFKSIRQFRNWCVTLAVIGLVMSFYTITQFQKGPGVMKEEMPEYSWMIDANTWQDATGKDFFRPFSTTANPGGASTWMQCFIPIILAAVMFKRISHRLRIFLFCVLAIFVSTLFVSLIRQMTMVTVASVTMILIFQFFSGRLNRSISGMLIIGLIGLIGWQVASGIGGGAMQENVKVLTNPFEEFMRNRGHSYSHIGLIPRFYPLGAGLGRTGPASVKFANEIEEYWQKYSSPTTPRMMPGENYFLLMFSETGIPGTVMICLIALAFLWKGWQSYRSIEDDDLKWAAAASLGVLTSIVFVFFGGPALVQAPLNLFFWFLGGVLLKMPVLDRELHQNASPIPT